jgi:hypothetical protein
MKRANYREAVAWIAYNHSAGYDDALDPVAASELITSVLVADLFGVDSKKVGRDIVRFRQRMSPASPASQLSGGHEHDRSELR